MGLQPFALGSNSGSLPVNERVGRDCWLLQLEEMKVAFRSRNFRRNPPMSSAARVLLAVSTVSDLAPTRASRSLPFLTIV